MGAHGDFRLDGCISHRVYRSAGIGDISGTRGTKLDAGLGAYCMDVGARSGFSSNEIFQHK